MKIPAKDGYPEMEIIQTRRGYAVLPSSPVKRHGFWGGLLGFWWENGILQFFIGFGAGCAITLLFLLT